MTVSLYTVSIPVFITNLKNLSKFLEKGSSHANASSIIGAKLIDDMGGLPYQIQRCSDAAKGLAVRSGGIAPVALADNETTFPEIQERIKKTIEILESVKEADFAAEDKEIVIPRRDGETKMANKDYILKWAIPNFFFHVCMAYAILRKEGVDVGKLDYLGMR